MTWPVAVLTGGARGIGAAAAALLADSGYDLCLGYRARDADAVDLADRLRRTGAQVRVVRSNVSDEAMPHHSSPKQTTGDPWSRRSTAPGFWGTRGRWSRSTPSAGRR